jgi:predicted exporter
MSRFTLAEALAILGVVGVAMVVFAGATIGWRGFDVILLATTIVACLYACHYYGWRRPLAMIVTIPLAVAAGAYGSIYLASCGLIGGVVAVGLFVAWCGYLAWAKSRRIET